MAKSSNRRFAFIFLPVLFAGGCSTTTVSQFDQSPQRVTFTHNAHNPGDYLPITQMIGTQIASGLPNIGTKTRKTATTKSFISGQKNKSSCSGKTCYFDVVFYNGEHTNSMGDIVATQTFRFEISFNTWDRGIITFPSSVETIERRNPIGIKRKALLSESDINDIAKAISELKIPKHYMYKSPEAIRQQQASKDKDNFNNVAKVKKSIGDKICNSYNRFGYVEAIAKDNIKIRLAGQVIQQKENYFFSTEPRSQRFSYQAVTGPEIIWDKSSNWGHCDFGH